MLYFQSRDVLEVLDKLITIAEDKNLARPKKLGASFSLPHVTFEKSEGKLPAQFQELRDQAVKAAPIAVPTSVDLSFDRWSLRFELPVTEVWWKAQVSPTSPQPGQPATLNGDHVDPWLRAIATGLSAHADRPVMSRAPAPARESLAAHVAAARRMEQTAANITEQLAKVAIERDRAFSKKQEELEASVAAQRGQLSKERLAFEQEKAERDSRQATVVRRQLLTETLKALDAESKVILSPETNSKRFVIMGALGFAMLLGVSLVVVALLAELKGAQGQVVLRTLGVSGVVLFASSLWYFVRWQDRWQQTHAAAELQNRKIRKDILRASWLAELVIETGKDDKVQLPDTFLEGMSRGLFVAPSEAMVTEHPLEVLFKRARLGRLKIGKTGIELTKQQPK